MRTARVFPAKKKAKKIDVDAVASLAKLTIGDDKKEKLEQDMESVIDFANALNALDTDGVPVREHLVPTSNVFREDEPEQNYTRAELLANAKPKQRNISPFRVLSNEKRGKKPCLNLRTLRLPKCEKSWTSANCPLLN